LFSGLYFTEQFGKKEEPWLAGSQKLKWKHESLLPGQVTMDKSFDFPGLQFLHL
jgi:hypothetical protein